MNRHPQKLIRIYILQKLRKLQVKKRFSSIRKNLHKQMTKEMRVDPAYKIHIQTLGVRFSVCKVNDYSGIELAKKQSALRKPKQREKKKRKQRKI